MHGRHSFMRSRDVSLLAAKSDNYSLIAKDTLGDRDTVLGHPLVTVPDC